MRGMITRRRFVLAAFLLLVAGVAVVDYWSIAANAATSPAISSNAMATGVAPSDHHGTQLSASTASLLPARPLSKKDWKRYIANKYRQVIESKLRFDLVDLYTPRRVFDNDEDDSASNTYHLENAPRGFDTLYRQWEQMRAEELERRKQLDAHRLSRTAQAGEDEARGGSASASKPEPEKEKVSKDARRLAKQQRRKDSRR